MEPMRVKSLFNDTPNDLFTSIAGYLSADWMDSDMIQSLNEQYFIWHSGEKTLSRFAVKGWGIVDDDREEVADGDVRPITSGTYDILARVIVGRYGDKWKSKYELLTRQYDLDGIETLERTETPDVTVTETNESSKTRTPNLTRHNESASAFKSTVTDSDQESDTNVQGFNSTAYQPLSQVKSQGTTTTEGGASDNHTSSSQIETGTDTNIETGGRTSTEKGTRSVIESRKRGDITAEIRRALELRNVAISAIILDDVDTILATPYYSL